MLTSVILVYKVIILYLIYFLIKNIITKMKEVESIKDSRLATKCFPFGGGYYKTTEYLVKWKGCSELVTVFLNE